MYLGFLWGYKKNHRRRWRKWMVFSEPLKTLLTLQPNRGYSKVYFIIILQHHDLNYREYNLFNLIEFPLIAVSKASTISATRCGDSRWVFAVNFQIVCISTPPPSRTENLQQNNEYCTAATSSLDGTTITTSDQTVVYSYTGMIFARNNSKLKAEIICNSMTRGEP